MLEIYSYGDNLDALNIKESQLKQSGYQFEFDEKDDADGRDNIDTLRDELINDGFDVIILKARDRIRILSKKIDNQHALGQ